MHHPRCPHCRRRRRFSPRRRLRYTVMWTVGTALTATYRVYQGLHAWYVNVQPVASPRRTPNAPASLWVRWILTRPIRWAARASHFAYVTTLRVSEHLGWRWMTADLTRISDHAEERKH